MSKKASQRRDGRTWKSQLYTGKNGKVESAGGVPKAEWKKDKRGKISTDAKRGAGGLYHSGGWGILFIQGVRGVGFGVGLAGNCWCLDR